MRSLAVVVVLVPSLAAARPAARGVSAEAGLGAGGVIGADAAWVQPGPALTLRVGYDLWSWLTVGVAAAASTHEATVPAPPVGEYLQLYRGRADARLTARLDAVALYLEGGAGAAMMSSNVLAKVGVVEPGQRFSPVLAGGGGLEYQLQNRHYAVGLGGEYWVAPSFTGLQGVEVRAFLRYTYGGSR
ncbi:MAG: hypothetical protein R3B06_30055 [Kofleriaceae bacterium]